MEKTYVFDTNSGGLNSEALIASLMNNRGVDPNLMAMLTRGGSNQDAWGGNGVWWIWIIIMFWLWGGNGRGFGNGFGGGLDGIPNQLNNDFGRDILLQAINGNGTAISHLASTLNCDINAIQAGNCQLGNQLAQCCCNIQDSITRQGYENQIATSNQTNALQATMNGNNQANLARLDAMSNQALLDKIDALREKNSTLVAQLSNEHQTAAIQA